jgi:hypothetical protein
MEFARNGRGGKEMRSEVLTAHRIVPRAVILLAVGDHLEKNRTIRFLFATIRVWR